MGKFCLERNFNLYTRCDLHIVYGCLKEIGECDFM